MKILFLDIDGVLNSDRSIHACKMRGSSDSYRVNYLLSKCDPIAVLLLNKITDTTGAKIVVSSSNRKPLGEAGVKKVLEDMGVTGEIIGITPSCSGVRGNEVQRWLDAHEDVTHYVILDDSSDFLAEQLRHFVCVDGRFGISFKDFSDSVLILGAQVSSLILP